MARFTGRTFRLVLMLILNFADFIVELIFGFTSNSMVLLADAFNVLSDFLGVVIALACMKIAARGPSDKNTYGWMRCDVLGALINSVFMIALCITIMIDSVQRFIQPEPVDKPFTVLIVGIVGLLVNLVGIFALKDYRSVPKQEKQPISVDVSIDKQTDAARSESMKSVTGVNKKGVSSQMNMYGAYLHVLGDALGSVIVIICAIVDWQVTTVPFLQNYLDPILSILMAIMLTVSSVGLLKDSALTLLQAVPTQVNLMNLKMNIQSKSRHIVEVNNLHVWQLSSEKLVASVRIRFDDALPWEKMIALVSEVENCFYDEGIHVVTVQPEIFDSGDNQSMIVDGIRYESSRHRCETCIGVDPAIAAVLSTPELNHLRVSLHGPNAKPSDDVTVWM